MEAFFNFLFDNLFIVIIIIGGILSFFRNQTGKEEQKKKKPYNKKPNAPKPTPAPSGGNYQKTRTNAEEKSDRGPSRTESLKDEQRKQMEKLTSRIHTVTTKQMDNLPHPGFASRTLNEQKQALSQHRENVRKQIKSRLKREGLIDSVIMAEVLGRPRALKPYRSIMSERKN